MDLGYIAGLILLAAGAVGGLVLLGYTLDWTIRRHDDDEEE